MAGETERRLTKRQQISRFLKNPQTIWELRSQFGGKVKDLVDDLEHIRKSVGEKNMNITTSRCYDCGFITKKTKFVALSHCPKCKSERTSDPVVQIKE